jgi:hypothetical protein
MRAGGYEKPACRACGALTRRKFAIGKGKNARIQHSKWRVCERGHQQYVKKGQAG